MLSVGALSVFNILVLLVPPPPVSKLLNLMALPVSARMTLLAAVAVNVVASVVYDDWGAQNIAKVIGVWQKWYGGRRRIREGKAYKAVEGGMRGSHH